MFYGLARRVDFLDKTQFDKYPNQPYQWHKGHDRPMQVWRHGTAGHGLRTITGVIRGSGVCRRGRGPILGSLRSILWRRVLLLWRRVWLLVLRGGFLGRGGGPGVGGGGLFVGGGGVCV